MSSLVMAMRRGRESAFGRLNSFTVIVAGSSWPMRFAPNSSKYMMPVVAMTMPYGCDRGCGIVISFISPVCGLSFPIMFEFSIEKIRLPCLSQMGVCGSRAAGLPVGYSVMSPVFGFSLPM